MYGARSHSRFSSLAFRNVRTCCSDEIRFDFRRNRIRYARGGVSRRALIKGGKNVIVTARATVEIIIIIVIAIAGHRFSYF